MKGEIDILYKTEVLPFRLGIDPDTNLKKMQVTDMKVMSPMYTNERPAEARIPYLQEVNLFQETFHGGCGQRYFDNNMAKYYDSEGADASIIRKIVRGPKIVKSSNTGTAFSGSGVKCFNFNSKLYAAWGQRLYEFDTDHWKDALDTGAAITDVIVWGDYVLIAHAAAAAYGYWDGTDLTACTNTVHNIALFSMVADTLWGSSSDYEVRSTANPLNGGAWSTASVVGNANAVITGMVSHPSEVYVGTEDMLYVLDTDGLVSAVDNVFNCYANSYSCRNMMYASSYLYIPVGSGDLFEYSSSDGAVSRLSSWIYNGDINKHTGKVLAMAHDNWFHYIVLDNGTEIEILKARWEYLGGKATWVWHPIGSVTGLEDSANNCNHAFISNLGGSLRLWITCSNATNGIYYLHIPTNYADPDSDSAFLFNASSSWYSSFFRGKMADTNKCFYRVGLRLRGVSATYPVALYYRVNPDDSWVTLNASITTGDYVLVSFPDNTYARQVQFKVTMSSSTYTASAVIEGISVYYAEYASIDSKEERFSINDRWEFVMHGGADTFWQHADYHDTPKAFFTLSVQTFGISTDDYITVSYKLDDSPNWYEFQEKITTGPWQTLIFPDNTWGNIITLNFVREDEDATELLTYKISGKLMPNKQKQFLFTVYLSDTEMTPTGGAGMRSVTELAEILREIDNEKWPVYIETFNGYKTWVTFDLMHELCMYKGPGKNPEYWFTITATEAKI